MTNLYFPSIRYDLLITFFLLNVFKNAKICQLYEVIVRFTLLPSRSNFSDTRTYMLTSHVRKKLNFGYFYASKRRKKINKEKKKNRFVAPILTSTHFSRYNHFFSLHPPFFFVSTFFVQPSTFLPSPKIFVQVCKKIKDKTDQQGC